MPTGIERARPGLFRRFRPLLATLCLALGLGLGGCAYHPTDQSYLLMSRGRPHLAVELNLQPRMEQPSQGSLPPGGLGKGGEPEQEKRELHYLPGLLALQPSLSGQSWHVSPFLGIQSYGISAGALVGGSSALTLSVGRSMQNETLLLGLQAGQRVWPEAPVFLTYDWFTGDFIRAAPGGGIPHWLPDENDARMLHKLGLSFYLPTRFVLFRASLSALSDPGLRNFHEGFSLGLVYRMPRFGA